MKVPVREVALKQEDREHLWLSSIISVYGRFIAINLHKGASRAVIANNPPLLITHAFPPVELDYDIIRPKRVIRRRVVMTTHATSVHDLSF